LFIFEFTPRARIVHLHNTYEEIILKGSPKVYIACSEDIQFYSEVFISKKRKNKLYIINFLEDVKDLRLEL